MSKKSNQMRSRRSKTNIQDLLPSAVELANSSGEELQFVELLQNHMNSLSWQVADLYEATGISATQIYGWLRLNKINKLEDPSTESLAEMHKTLGTRYVSKEEINRIAVAIATAYDEKFENNPSNKPFAQGMDWLDKTLNDLLISTGYPTIQGRKSDTSLYRVIAKKAIRVGWFEWADFAIDTAISQRAHGHSFQILERICALIGVEFQPIDVNLDNFIDKLTAGEIDITAPMIRLPFRVINLCCSRNLPLTSGINILCNVEFKDQLTDAGEETQIDWSKVQLNYMRGGTPGLLKSMMVDRNALNPAIPVHQHSRFSSAIESVLHDPVYEQDGNQFIRCFLADEQTCRKVVRENKNAETLLERYPHKIPLTIAAHRGEDKLIEMINYSLDIMEEDKFFEPMKSEVKA